MGEVLCGSWLTCFYFSKQILIGDKTDTLQGGGREIIKQVRWTKPSTTKCLFSFKSDTMYMAGSKRSPLWDSTIESNDWFKQVLHPFRWMHESIS